MQKVWLISGCSKGFGRVLTEELLTNTNAFVIATAREPGSLGDLVAQYPDRNERESSQYRELCFGGKPKACESWVLKFFH